MSKYRLFVNDERVILRIVIEKDGKIENFFVHKGDTYPCIGNIYKGKIEKVMPGLNSAFVNIGETKSGFLQIDKSDFYFPFEEDLEEEFYFENYLPVEEVLVQISKPGEDEKSPKITEKISIPGRYFVLLPNLKIQRISKKIKDERKRRKLLNFFKREIGENTGFIIRTSADMRKETYIKREIRYLMNLWRKIKRDFKRKKAPCLLWKELPLYLKVVRDYVNEDFIGIFVDSEFIYNEIKEYVDLFIPEMRGKIYLYKERVPMFIKYGFEEKIESFFSNIVNLPSGGYIIIEKGETLTAIDVNSGKTEEGSFEKTIFRTNLEAAEEIPRQIRCRNISGIIVVDFIDMKEEYLRVVLKKFFENIKKDKGNIKFSFVPEFGIALLCKEKNDYSIYNLFFKECGTCEGKGILKEKELIFLEMKKKFFEIFKNNPYNKIEVLVSQSLYEFIFKNQLFKNFIFSDRIKFKVESSIEIDNFKIVEVS